MITFEDYRQKILAYGDIFYADRGAMSSAKFAGKFQPYDRPTCLAPIQGAGDCRDPARLVFPFKSPVRLLGANLSSLNT
ncbi:hypothetical protein LAV84_20570 [Rhizobium sp. VS19-DR104.2]|uniref:hypothetical protein n=1 Tax=unclassified Rhizobium TaxID=2613769 RepID=UPI001C5AA5A2|nr:MULTISPECIES: hypothetical protein [unclassified Rhizobium]MBZ5762371.1 hypothetical protein [Rhizobium sp. VS19-DR96]MBZ5769123.1 hypothetical protein [Rhizobium sp. VS19-DR129.2]MBZ5775951.1 hypothetical protein [Rhizobium sp. VS19-DRK62.2]MBZ5786285.1 hypothetical protein [Rhizobium sp. VS19-DR121]MBZ5804279.1 hypothetical protein [Rhizobium sp. VS19-DR181]